MPWNVGRKTAKGWPIIKTSTGQVVGHSITKAMAERAVAARYANTNEKKYDGRTRAMKRLGYKKSMV